MTIDTTIKTAGLTWKEANNGVKISQPGRHVQNTMIHLAFIPAGKTMVLSGSARVTIALMQGSLARPSLEQNESITIRNIRSVQAQDDSLLVLCVETPNTGKDVFSATVGTCEITTTTEDVEGSFCTKLTEACVLCVKDTSSNESAGSQE